MQERYLSNVEGGDELCGRLICGLKFSYGSKFGVIPPRYPPACDILSDAVWIEILPNYSNYPASFQRCIPFHLAQICYHYDWLTEKDEGMHSDKCLL